MTRMFQAVFSKVQWFYLDPAIPLPVDFDIATSDFHIAFAKSKTLSFRVAFTRIFSNPGNDQLINKCLLNNSIIQHLYTTVTNPHSVSVTLLVTSHSKNLILPFLRTILLASFPEDFTINKLREIRIIFIFIVVLPNSLSLKRIVCILVFQRGKKNSLYILYLINIVQSFIDFKAVKAEGTFQEGVHTCIHKQCFWLSERCILASTVCSEKENLLRWLPERKF